MSLVYHFNIKTGETGRCKATMQQCPLGPPSTHFTSEQAAREGYEAAMATESLKTLRKEGKQAPKTLEAFNDAAFKFFDLSSSKVLVPPRVSDPAGGYMGGRRFVGGKVEPKNPDGTTKYLSQADAAKLIRADIKAAKDAGEIPEWLDVSVRKASGAWVTSIDMTIGMKVDGKTRAIPEHWLRDGYRLSEQTRRIKNYIRNVGLQYATDDSNPMVDYFNSHLMPNVKFRSEWEDRHK